MRNILILLFIFTTLHTFGQGRFKAALLGGFNVSQVDGDNLYGYHKLGANAGVKAFAMFNEKFSLSFELLFAQKGSRSRTSQGLGYKLTLNYAEIPVLFHYHDREKIIFGAGLSYSRFINYKRIEQGINTTDSAPPVYKRDIMAVAGITYFFSKRLGLNGRYAYSIIPITHDAGSKFPGQGVYNNLISFRLMYMF